MAGRQNRGMRRLIYDRARATGCSPFEAIDQIIDEMKNFRLPGEYREPEPVIRNGKRWSDDWRGPRGRAAVRRRARVRRASARRSRTGGVQTTAGYRLGRSLLMAEPGSQWPNAPAGTPIGPRKRVRFRAFSAKVETGFASENATKQELRARSLTPISLNAL